VLLLDRTLRECCRGKQLLFIVGFISKAVTNCERNAEILVLNLVVD